VIEKATPAPDEPDSASGTTRATALYRAIKQDIIRGELGPNEWLRIPLLRQRYGAGASPVREALNRLSSEGLVQQIDQRGFTVSGISEADLEEIEFTRIALNRIMVPAIIERGDDAWEESVVLAHYRLSKVPPFLSDGRLNEVYLQRHRDFHMTLLSPCGSRWLMELSAKLFDFTERHQNFAMRGDIFGTRDVAGEHNELVKALLARDVEKSIQLFNDHVRSTARLVKMAANLQDVARGDDARGDVAHGDVPDGTPS
jgi:DNA-binding GntR family transcriptional regulator